MAGEFFFFFFFWNALQCCDKRPNIKKKKMTINATLTDCRETAEHAKLKTNSYDDLKLGGWATLPHFEHGHMKWVVQELLGSKFFLK